MTVSTTSNSITYSGNGSTTDFSFPFPGVAASDIQVFTTSNLGVVTQLLTTQYTVILNAPVAPNPTGTGGSVHYPLVGSPLPVGWSITISRVLPQTQPVSLANQSVLYQAVIEEMIDYVTMLCQDLTGASAKSFMVGASDPAPATVPPVASRANQLAFFDASGNLTAGGTATSVVSAAMQPVVAASTLALARSLMGVAPTASPAFTGDPTAPTAAPGDNDTSVATTAFVQNAILSLGAAFTTGDLKPTHKTAADSGWILWVDGTIGGGASGSSVRANADTQALFTLYYNGYSDAVCPLLTSGGVATTRVAQGTAATAFTANCRMTLPKGSSRGIGLAGSGSGLTARALGTVTGAETVVQSIAQMPAHTHTLTDPGHTHSVTDPGHVHTISPQAATATGTYASGPLNFTATTGANQTDSATAGIGINASTTGVTAQNNGSGAAMNVMNPMAYINVMIKL